MYVKSSMKKFGDNKKKQIEIKKTLKFSAYSGVLFIAIFFIFAIINQIITVSGLENLLVMSSVIFAFLMAFFSLSFIYGFVILGKRFDNKLLVILAYVMIILWILYLILALFGNSLFDFTKITNDPVFQDYISSSAIDKQLAFEDLSPAAQEFIINFAKIVIVIAILCSVYLVLFGLSLLRLKDKVKYSKVSGILNIIAGITLIIIVGIFVKMIAFILEIMMFFEASKKFEDSKNIKRR